MPNEAMQAPGLDASLTSVFDAVHGTIDLRDVSVDGSCSLAKLLNAPMVERLRRIKLLGYASHSYPAADHSRYAHTLGTVHVMRRICDRLRSTAWLDKALPHLARFGAPKIETRDQLMQHMLIAALLQDVGELPYGHATARVLRASDQLREFVKRSVGGEISGWSDKDVFTVASLFHDEYCKNTPINRKLVAFLITGFLAEGTAPEVPLLSLRQALDGEVDADRLDYVFRDAHHTVGGRGTPRAVIDSLLYYDETGSVFSDPASVAEFLATRALLWTSVYFSAENRFRTLLLITLLKGVLTSDGTAAGQIVLGDSPHGDLSYRAFCDLDDISLHARLRELREDSASHRLDPRAEQALDILLGTGAEYDCFWLAPQQAGAPTAAAPYVVQPDVFFDTFSDYLEDHSVYQAGSIRVAAARFRFMNKPVPMEDCCGAFSEIFKRSWNAVERPGSVLLFVPRALAAGGLEELQKAVENASFYTALADLDPLSPIDEPADTRRMDGFSPPSVFISFSWEDVKVVRRLVKFLYRERQQYYLLLRPSQGVGDTPSRNSERAVNEAGAVLVLASTSWVNRNLEDPNGNIHREVTRMAVRIEQGLVVVPLSADPHTALVKFPHSDLKMNQLPFVGPPLRHATDGVFQATVRDALERIRGARHDNR